MSFYVHESSYVDENVSIGDMTKKIILFSFYFS